MKFSFKFLEEFLNLKGITPRQLAEKLTLAGLEVSQIERKEGDFIFEVEVTSNRYDLLSIVGIAYEVSALFKKKIKLPKINLRTRPLLNLPLKIEDEGDCPLYTARLIKGVRVGPSPDWLKYRLTNLGINSVNNVVDITNYCMLKWGEPLHAFDFDKIGNIISVRRARKGERLLCIDNKERELRPEVLVIADENKPLALAGVIGGQDSEVSLTTKNILIEAAIFSPLTIRRGRRSLGVESESSYRFERGVNPLNLEKASASACELILKLAGGEFSGYKRAGKKPSAKSFWIKFDIQRLNNFLGTSIKEKQALQILKRLNFNLKEKPPIILVKPPSYRQDIKFFEDLAEEVARIWGYQNIKEALPPIKRSLKEEASFYKFKEKIKDKLVSLGFSEAITFSIISEKENISSYKPLFLENPLRKEENILRPEIFPGLLKVFQYNVYRKERELEFFEIAESFFKIEPGFKEKTKLVIGRHTQNMDNFYYFKAKLEVFLADCGIKEFSLKESSLPAFSNYALIEDWGWVGVLNKEVSRRLDLENVFIAEFDLEELYQKRKQPYFEEIVRFPWVERDISLAKRKELSFREIEDIIKTQAGKFLKEFRVVDIYKGEKIPSGFTGFTLRIFYQHKQRTLSSEEVDKIHFQLREALAQKEGLILR
ncbi:MAG: phenylalanine--tRNA ligase subunit beta [Candidatus Omnitrophota bacterium]|nr:MAG: phenylalanine--tRNA ligase subunit beta [Candidatus Omnitrophota bacterium]